MVQWVNHPQNNISVNLLPLPLLCEISGGLHLVQPGLMTGWQADKKMQVNFKIGCRPKYPSFTSFNQDTASLQPNRCIPAGFLDKAYCKVDY